MDKKKELQKIKQDLDDITHRITLLKNDIKRSGIAKKAESKAQLEHILTDLEKRKKELETKYSTLEKASEDKWEGLKKNLKEALENLKKAYTSATKKLK